MQFSISLAETKDIASWMTLTEQVVPLFGPMPDFEAVLLIETCKLNAVDPYAYLARALTAIVNGHKQSRIGELLPWNNLVV
jgi:hypothetical protein